MTALRVLIVDDEPLARQRLLHLLAEIPGTEVVGECADGTDAVKAISDLAPDVVLLDVQMREMGGFALVDAIAADRMPSVVFVTAHDEFAIRAFDVNAVDYLLKPVQTPQLARALQRVVERRRAIDPDLRGNLRALLETVKTLLGETSATTTDLLEVVARLLLDELHRKTELEVADDAANAGADRERCSDVRLHFGRDSGA